MTKKITKVGDFDLCQLAKDIEEIIKKCKEKGYIITEYDYFALGYLCASEGLDRIINNKKAVLEACESYDLKDGLTLFDTISEVLLDLEIV